MMKYFQNCENRGLLPRPRFSNLIKDNMLVIRDAPVNMDEILTLREIILEGQKSAKTIINKDSTVIKKLLIDDAKMDDEKISFILDTIQE